MKNLYNLKYNTKKELNSYKKLISIDLYNIIIFYKKKLLPGFEPGLIGLKPMALTTTPQKLINLLMKSFKLILNKKQQLVLNFQTFIKLKYDRRANRVYNVR